MAAQDKKVGKFSSPPYGPFDRVPESFDLRSVDNCREAISEWLEQMVRFYRRRGASDRIIGELVGTSRSSITNIRKRQELEDLEEEQRLNEIQ